MEKLIKELGRFAVAGACYKLTGNYPSCESELKKYMIGENVSLLRGLAV